jgi:hypothetical protein
VNRAAFDCSTVNLELSARKRQENEIMVDVYPNPSQGQFSFVSPVKFDRIDIRDITGKQILFDFNTNAGTSTVSMNHCNSGVYIMTMFGNDGQILSTRKLVIE